MSEAKMDWLSDRKIQLSVGILVLLQILNLTVFGPWLADSQTQVLGNAIYISIHVLSILSFSALSPALFNFGYAQTIRWNTGLEFLLQVILKGLIILLQSFLDPKTWGELSFGPFTLNLIASYVFSIPFIILLSFLGFEFGNLFSKSRN
jgi:hypothetical protein